MGQYIKHPVQERYFEVEEKEDYFSPYPHCTVWPELRPEDVDENPLCFICYVAVCYTVYGTSYNTVITDHYLDLFSQLRPDMVKQLKTGGSGKLPKDIQRRKTEHLTAPANDAFATIRITARDSTEECYAEILDYLCAVPGTFAVFALGLEGEQWAALVAEYLNLCDDEHTSLQEKFLHAFIRKFDFQLWTLGVLVRGALSMQWLKPAKEFCSLIANAESLDALLTVKHRFSAYLLPEENKDPKCRAIAW